MNAQRESSERDMAAASSLASCTVLAVCDSCFSGRCICLPSAAFPTTSLWQIEALQAKIHGKSWLPV